MKRYVHYLLGPAVGTTAAFLCSKFHKYKENIKQMDNCYKKNVDYKLIN